MQVASRTYSRRWMSSLSYEASQFARSKVPHITNEPFLQYLVGSGERKALIDACKSLRSVAPVEVPCIVNGREVKTGDIHEQRIPSDHSKVLARYHHATPELIKEAIKGSMAARSKWHSLSFDIRAGIFLKAAELLSNEWRARVLAATMLGQGKTVWQAEIDAAVETIDFWRFNVKYAEQLYEQQPPTHSKGVWNRLEYRPLDGFVAAISPFNFTAIGANLSSAPALMGNTVVWKPAPGAILSNYYIYKILQEAGLPDGVIQFLPCDGPLFGDSILSSSDFAGLHFTGSTKTFDFLTKQIHNNLEKFSSYPRIVGETGGKDFHFMHESADVDNFVAQTIRGAYEYCGQKCSATSRAYIPRNKWQEVSEKLLSEMKRIKVGQSDDFSSFISAVTDKTAFKKITSYIELARSNPKEYTILFGGKYDDSRGYFIEPTLVLTSNPNSTLMREEIFGPVLTVYVYPESEFEQTLQVCGSHQYALTGSIFASDVRAVAIAYEKLRFAAGNFYINDKCTGAMVGQQPFGGSKRSGTNDKSGGIFNLLRWVSVRTVKESFTPLPLKGWSYPHLSPESGY